jgi:hypothetical protein
VASRDVELCGQRARSRVFSAGNAN